MQSNGVLMDIFLIGRLLLAAAFFLLSLYSFLTRGVFGVSSLFRLRKAEKDDGDHRLINQCFGDRDRAEGLIQHEIRKNPYLSRSEAIEDASDRITSDMR